MKPALKKTIYTLFVLISLMVSGIIFGSAAIYLYLNPKLPSVESIRDVRLQTPLRVYSSDGKLIGEFGEKRRRPVKLEDVPQPFIDALLAAEDFEFYSHHGVSIRGLARAVAELITTGERGSGGSTLTMQLTRNVFLSLDRKFIRKFNEILLSLKLEQELSKDEILELYVNYMFLGKRAYGIQAAAEVYYGKSLSELSLAQLAMIAGLFQGPSTQNPIINPTRAIERRNWILRRMQSLDLINDEQFNSAFKESITAEYHGSPLEASAPYVAELAREKTIRSFGLDAYTEGYRVITTIDSHLQVTAQNAVTKGLLAFDKRKGFRGAESNLGKLRIIINQELNQSPDEDSPLAPPAEVHPWLEALNKIPRFAGLEPVAVTAIHDTNIEVLSQNGKTITLNWEDGLSSARRFINENTRGALPQSAGEIVKLGDVIRIKRSDEGVWRLSQKPDVQAALVALNPNNGAITSIVGGFDFYENQFNRATQAYRQPGSNLKPFIYTAGLEQGMTAATLINDAPIVLNDSEYEGTWRPKNSGNKFLGPIRLRQALYQSRNLASIRLLKELGINNARNALTRFGFNPKILPRDLSLALGNSSVTPIELATAWAIFANGGYKVSAHLIERVYDNDGHIIYEAFPDSVCRDCDTQLTENETEQHKTQNNGHSVENDPNQEDLISDIALQAPPEAFELPVTLKRALGWLEPEDYPRAPKVIDDQVVFIMDSILKDVIRRGTARKARSLNRFDIAGKTGTTNGPVDLWFSGYNQGIITTTWVGFDNNTPLGNNEFGSTSPLPIWMDYMQEALKYSKPKSLAQPPGIMSIKIDPETGKRAKIDDPDAVFEYFRTDHAPEAEAESSDGNNNSPLEIFSEEVF